MYLHLLHLFGLPNPPAIKLAEVDWSGNKMLWWLQLLLSQHLLLAISGIPCFVSFL